MKIFKGSTIIEVEEGFDIEILKQKLEENLKEVRYRCVGFEYIPKNYNIIPEIPALNKVLDTFVYYVLVDEYFDYRIALACFTGLEHGEYPYFDIFSINPGFIDRAE